jgi:MFS family permease
MNVHKFGLASPSILAALLGSAALLAAFIWWELRTSTPMLDVRLFKRKTFSFGVSANFLIFLGGSAVLFLTPFYLQRVLGYTPWKAGLIVVPGALLMAFLGPLSGRLSDRYGWRMFTVGGLALSVTGLFILSRLTEGSSLALIMSGLILQSCGMGVFYSPNTSSVLSVVERERYGVVSAFLNLTRNSANVSSVAAATAIVTATMGAMDYEPSLAAVSCGVGSGVCAAFTLGLQKAYRVMMLLLLAAMAVSAFKFEKLRELPPVPSP